MLSVFSPARFIIPPVKDQICLAWEENMGYVGGGRLSYGIH